MKKRAAIDYFREPGDTEYQASVRVAEALGIRVQAVYQWADEIPELRALQLEKLTGGRLAA